MATVKRTGKLDKLEARLENAIKRGLIESGMIVAQRATQKAPRKTGRLKRSITHGDPEKVDKLKWKIAVGTNVEYAAIQELGGTTPPHEIRPKNKKALRFLWPEGPDHLKQKDKSGALTDWVILGKVNHPGSKIPAQPYLRPALEESKPIIRALIIRNVVAAFE